ncbi:hypothetical protein GCM10010971_27110 [Silvimonas amylolytica]|uniref:Major facilitator superfamily (MFS) profile domain-containing protein n=1 Tax=Silvimonas amylolytica TaxID=449663 RepID=A0ABQ2PMP5_9NEIS|nr:hypothetical protein GCM10010971_27110 [Silvimonas amylolytica]
MNDFSVPQTGQQTRAPLQYLTLLALCLAVLVAQVDTAVINLAARAIGIALAAGTSQLQWVVDSYNLLYASLLLTGGGAGGSARSAFDIHHRRRTVYAGFCTLFCRAQRANADRRTFAGRAGRCIADPGVARFDPGDLARSSHTWASLGYLGCL